jgi:chromosome segregation ATPase
MLFVAGVYGYRGNLYATARDLAALRKEREFLAAEVERLQTVLAVETATRRELERQAAELNSQVAELNGHVKFLMVRGAAGKGAQ